MAVFDSKVQRRSVDEERNENDMAPCLTPKVPAARVLRRRAAATAVHSLAFGKSKGHSSLPTFRVDLIRFILGS
jgi:hypothetical protein